MPVRVLLSVKCISEVDRATWLFHDALSVTFLTDDSTASDARSSKHFWMTNFEPLS